MQVEIEARPGVICVDLDGTLLVGDSLAEGLAVLVRTRPWLILMMPLWLLRGRAFFKSRFAAWVTPDFARLPVRLAVLQWLQAQRAAGARLWLCTGAPQAWAQAAADHFGLFEGVLSSDVQTNLTGRKKAQLLVQRFGARGFCYCGNEYRDLHVWRHASQAMVAGSPALAAAAAEHCTVLLHVNVEPASAGDWGRALRVHQWAKNLLLFVPLLAAHRALDVASWQQAALGFAAFCLTASSLYLLNDLIDLPADRLHPQKRNRPMASGQLPMVAAAIAVVVLAVAATLVALQSSGRFAQVLVGYVVATLAYSWWLKRIALLDTLMLAGLYTVRLLAGAMAVHVPLSFWLLACSGFLFFSLALVKRSAELRLWQRQGETTVAGRGYQASDLPLVDAIGIAAGLLSVLVLALYMNSSDVRMLYAHPQVLWGLCPLLTWWICRVWLLVHRGAMHDDPVVFALRDHGSLAAGAVGAFLVWAAT